MYAQYTDIDSGSSLSKNPVTSYVCNLIESLTILYLNMDSSQSESQSQKRGYKKS